jgi:hypothetical protein
VDCNLKVQHIVTLWRAKTNNDEREREKETYQIRTWKVTLRENYQEKGRGKGRWNVSLTARIAPKVVRTERNW